MSTLPRSLQALLKETKYPLENTPFEPISKVVMVVDSVSPTPFSLLRRARHFEFREDDKVLNKFSDFEDPVEALTDECKRVLKSISSANQSDSTTTKESTSLGNSSWSRFEDIGFSSLGDLDDHEESGSALPKKSTANRSIRSAAESKINDFGRPTTPSWADFLSSGFADETGSQAPRTLLLPPDKVLPPIELDLKRGKSAQSNRRPTDDTHLEPGELASTNSMNLDDAFWWVWITSLAGEETLARKAVFGRCALIETVINHRSWLVIEEMVKGAAPEPEVGAYIAEKKGRFTFGRKGRTVRAKPTNRHTAAPPKSDATAQNKSFSPASKTSIGPDQHARIQAAAAALQQKQKQQEYNDPPHISPRRARQGDTMSTKTNSVFTLQPVIMSEAAPAMKWANTYDKKSVRAAYLGDNFAGKGSRTDLAPSDEQLQPPPKQDYGSLSKPVKEDNRELPPLPAETPSEDLRAPTAPPPPIPRQPAPLPPDPFVQDSATCSTPQSLGQEKADRDLEQVQTVTQNDSRKLSPASSPEEGPKKLKKQAGTGGLRGIFGGKKKDVNSQAPLQPPDSSAVAAARAAYTGPKRAYGGSNSLTRRLSGVGRKKAPAAAAAAALDQDKSSGQPLAPPSVPFKEGNFESQTSLSRIDSHDQREADHKFKTFDNQGPLEQPAFVPDGLRRHSTFPESEASRPSTMSEPPRGPHFEPPIGRGQYEPSLSSQEDIPRQEEETTPIPEVNRWSQIRKNAAERAGKLSEEQKQRSVENSDRVEEQQSEDGEESGEESKYTAI